MRSEMGRCFCLCVLFALLSMLAPAARAQQSGEAEIRAVLDAQVAAWNAGDIDRFMQGYEDSPRTTFIGKTMRHGYRSILENYRKTYSDREKMGTLIFSDLDTRMLCATNAVTTGRYKLTFADGKPAQIGIFSLVWEKTPQGWKIVLDHTS
jgi:uncharacterized protein (TIGR02246 family)